MHCHGEKGDGNGTMIQSGAYGDLGVVPAYKSLDTLSEGKIFHSIYYGKGYMGAHGSLLNKKKYGHWFITFANFNARVTGNLRT
jgi:hypothetical protein